MLVFCFRSACEKFLVLVGYTSRERINMKLCVYKCDPYKAVVFINQ